jgi:hypothetical protein
MWDTPDGVRTLSSAEAKLIRAGIEVFVDELKDDCYPDDGLTRGISIFDELSRHQRIALIAKAAAALLRADVVAPSPSAVIEATVGAIFETIRTELICEVEYGGDNPYFLWRPLVLACIDFGDFDADAFHIDVTSTDVDDWKLLLECIQGAIVWDTDWMMSDQFLDAKRPKRARLVKRQMGITPNYFVTPAPDPKDDELPGIINGLEELLAYVGAD